LSDFDTREPTPAVDPVCETLPSTAPADRCRNNKREGETSVNSRDSRSTAGRRRTPAHPAAILVGFIVAATLPLSTVAAAAPVAVDDPLGNVIAECPWQYRVLANDTDADLNQLTISGVTDPAGGTATILNQRIGGVEVPKVISYVSDPLFIGADTFDYTVSDGLGGTDVGTVTLTVVADGGDTDGDGISDECDAFATDSTNATGRAMPFALAFDSLIDTTFQPLPPARLLDTRIGNGLSGPFSAGVPRTFQVSGRGGVPANATAVTGNLTVTEQSHLGFVFLGPNPVASPTSSTLNFPVGDNRANGVTVALSGTGALSATYGAVGGASTQLVFDVTGYFVPDGSGNTFHPLTPARLLDTRVGNGLSGPFSAGVPRTFQVSGLGGVPGTATAVTGNLTVTEQSQVGFVFLGPDPVASPTSSTLNFPVGDNRANGVTVALSGTGSLSATYGAVGGGTTHLVFDVTGFFVPGSSGATFVPLTPARVLDTRVGNGLSGSFGAGVPRTFAARSRGAVPASATAVTGNLTVTEQTRLGFVFLGPSAVASPTSSTLNFPVGDNRANGVTVALSGTGALSATYGAVGGGTTQLVFDVTGYFAPGSSPGGLESAGFTGLMTNSVTPSLDQYSAAQVLLNGTGQFQVNNVPEGDAFEAGDDLENGFQVNVNTPLTDFTVHGRLCSPYPPAEFASAGIFLGPGDQDNYIKAVIERVGTTTAVHDDREVNGKGLGIAAKADADIAAASCVDLYLLVDADTLTYAPAYSLDGGATKRGFTLGLGGRTVPASWINGTQPLAVGIVSTSQGPAGLYTARWDLLEVVPGQL
jgi:hypothetical protein